MAKKLKLSTDLSLVDDVAGEAIGILATRGAGKSFTSAVLVEELWRAKIQFAVLDPTGVYWGLRASSDGRSAGLSVIVLGGAHGDMPLEPTAGKLIADVLVDTGQSLILDMSDFESKASQSRFVADLGERLYTRKARNRTTLHLVIDEAHEFAPQKPIGRDEPRMLGAMERLVGRGRSRGIGSTLISQRSATLNKNVLDLIDTLIAMRVLSPRDRKAVGEWITAKEDVGAKDDVGLLDSLPGLPTGTAWVWSPVRGILQRIKVRRIETFDSYATPKPGEKRAEPRVTAPIDLTKLGEQMEATRERAKAEDPRELRKALAESRSTIVNLERRIGELEASPGKSVETIVEERIVEVPVVPAGAFEKAEQIIDRALGKLEQGLDRLKDAVTAGLKPVAGVLSAEEQFERMPSSLPRPTRPATQPTHPAPKTRQERPQSAREHVPEPRPARARDSGRIDAAAYATGDVGDVTKPERKILDALAWWEAIGIPKPTKQQVGIIAGYRVGKRIGGYYGNLLGALRSAGLIDYPEQGRAMLTAEGRALAQPPDIDATSAAIQSEVLSRCSGPEGKILEVLIAEYPDALSKQELGERAGYQVNDRVGGYFGNLLGALRTLGLITYPSKGYAAADPVLFLEER